jgi:hypothetical protein
MAFDVYREHIAIDLVELKKLAEEQRALASIKKLHFEDILEKIESTPEEMDSSRRADIEADMQKACAIEAGIKFSRDERSFL